MNLNILTLKTWLIILKIIQLVKYLLKNMLLEYMENVDDKMFKKYSNRKNFNSFINEFDHARKKIKKK